MAESGLDSLTRTHDVTIEWKAFELRPREAPPMDPARAAEIEARIAAAWPNVQQAARDRFGLEMRRPELGHRVDTRRAHVGGKVAEAMGQGLAWPKAVMRAYWQQGRDIGQDEVLADIAAEIGLAREAFLTALDQDQYLMDVMTDEHWAQRNGLNGVPAFIFGGRYLLSGAQPVAVLRRAADRCLQENLIQSSDSPVGK
jgi:predicted DsbA family dithiol-disulfide isomerase